MVATRPQRCQLSPRRCTPAGNADIDKPRICAFMRDFRHTIWTSRLPQEMMKPRRGGSDLGQCEQGSARSGPAGRLGCRWSLAGRCTRIRCGGWIWLHRDRSYLCVRLESQGRLTARMPRDISVDTQSVCWLAHSIVSNRRLYSFPNVVKTTTDLPLTGSWNAAVWYQPASPPWP